MFSLTGRFFFFFCFFFCFFFFFFLFCFGFFYQFEFDMLQALIARIIHRAYYNTFQTIWIISRWKTKYSTIPVCSLYCTLMYVFSVYLCVCFFVVVFFHEKFLGIIYHINYSTAHTGLFFYTLALFSVSTWNGLALYTCQINVWFFRISCKKKKKKKNDKP